jgi:MinD superfamily P-loop ATPase
VIEIVIISGKGGTGKTSITAALAMLAGKSSIIADCDVDAADMHLLLEPEIREENDFYSGTLAVIDPEKCTGCGECEAVCRFNAISSNDGMYRVIPLECEGCGYCSKVCPENAIKNEPVKSGKWFVSLVRSGTSMVHAQLGIGSDNSGKLVARVKRQAKSIAEANNNEFILVDGPPGIGCPVISSLSGANLVVLVTEPTISALHDLKRIYELVEGFGIKAACIINKSDLNREVTLLIRSFLERNKIIKLAEIPYDKEFTRSMINGKTIVESESGKLKNIMRDVWSQIEKMTLEKIMI